MLDPAELDFDTRDGLVVVRLDGEVDMGNADRVGRRIVTGVVEAQPEANAAALDLSGLSYVDSSGLRMLEEVRHHVSSKGVRLFTIAPESCRAHRLLALTGLLEHLATLPDLAAVLAAVDGASSTPG